MAERPFRILFVCTANICRSAYAQLRARQLAPAGRFAFASAGVQATGGRPIDPEMAAVLAERGVASWSFRSRPVTPALVEGAELVLTMEFAHQMKLLDRWPELAGRVFGLAQLAMAGPEVLDRTSLAAELPPNGMSLDVADPYGRGRRAALDCANEMDRLILGCLPIWERILTYG